MHKPRGNSRTGARILIDALQGHGLKHAFGVPGESYLAALDALLDSKIDFVVCRQEGGAAVLSHLMNGDDVIVLEGRRRPGLAEEALLGRAWV